MKRISLIPVVLILSTGVFAQDKELKINHLYFVLDSSTFENIKASAQLSTLVNFDTGIPKFEPIDSSSTTIYLRGKSTYIEIMGPANKFKEKVGSIGIGFSWDTHDFSNNKFEDKLENNPSLNFNKYETRWDFGNKQVLWYTAFYTDLKSHIATWYAYYNPEFLSYLYHSDYSIFTRELFLAKAYNSNKEIIDLSEITLNCNAQDYTKLTSELNCFVARAKKITSNSATFKIDNVNLKIMLTSNAQSIIKSLKFRTKHNISKRIALGNIILLGQAKGLALIFK
jgi:hypothetical protein